MARKRAKLKLVKSARPSAVQTYESAATHALERGRVLPVLDRFGWLKKKSYANLRRAAWFVRNYRINGHDDTAALATLTHEVKLLILDGEPLETVIPSLVDLFLRP